MEFTLTTGAKVKFNDKLLFEGDVFEADEKDVKNLITSGAVVATKEYKENPVAAEGNAKAKKKDPIKSGGKVETPKKEGALKNDGETNEL